MSNIQRRAAGSPSQKSLPHIHPTHPSSTKRFRRRPILLLPAFLAALLTLFLLLRRSTPLAPLAPLAPRAPSLFGDVTALTHAVVVAPSRTPFAAALRSALSLRAQAPALAVTIWHAAARPAGPLPPGVSAVLHPLRAPYAHVLRPLLPAAHPAAPPLFVLAGATLSPRALQWLAAARQRYAARPSVAAFFLDTARVQRWDGTEWQRVQRGGAGEEGGGALMWRLAEGGGAFVPNWGPDLDVWATFAEWLSLRKGEWYRYPEGGGVDGTPLGMEGRVERNWTRAGWNVWFSKFLHEYRLDVVYPDLKGAALVTHSDLHAGKDVGELYSGDVAAFEMPERPRRYAANGEKVEEQEEQEEEEAEDDVEERGGGGDVKRIVELGREQGGIVSFTMVNNIFLDTAKSWLCNVDVAGFRPRGLLWAVTDEESREAMATVPDSHTVHLEKVKGGKETGHEFGNPGYWKLMLERTALIGDILRNGVAVFAFETDAIWLEDPAPYIEELVQQDADIVGTINTRMEVSGNFFYLRPTLATRRLWDEITSEFGKAYRNAHLEKKEATSWTYIENDQSLLTKLVLRNETWRRSYPLSFLTLDMERFTDGRWYKPEEGFYTSKRAREPVVINNNFVIGVDEKTERAKKWGHWFWDEQTKQCLDDVVNKAVRKVTTSQSGEVLDDVRTP